MTLRVPSPEISVARILPPYLLVIRKFAFYVMLLAFGAYAARQIGRMHLFEWDESRYVLNAFEMMRSGDWVALRFGGELDQVFMKPPFAIWLMAILFKLFGYSQFIARAPSLVFGLGTGVLLYRFLLDRGTDLEVAALASLGLVMCWGFYGYHGYTGADLDAALAFFNTLSFIAIYLAFIEGRPRWCLVLGCSLGLGFLVKSVSGILPAAFVAPAVLLSRDRGNAWIKEAAQAAGLAVVVAVPWLAFRQFGYDDNYVPRMLGFVLGAIDQPVDNHAGGLWFYLDYVVIQLGPWFYAALASAGAGVYMFLRSAPEVRRDALRRPALRTGVYACLCALIYYIAFTSSQTKVGWYFIPVLPLFFAIVAVGFSSFMNFLPKVVRCAVLAALVVVNVQNSYRYDRYWRMNTHTPILDVVIAPNEQWIRGRSIIIEGTLPMNAFATVEILSDRKARTFPQGTPLDAMLSAVPDADFLLTVDARRHVGNDYAATDKRLRPIRVLADGVAWPGFIQLIRR